MLIWTASDGRYERQAEAKDVIDHGESLGKQTAKSIQVCSWQTNIPTKTKVADPRKRPAVALLKVGIAALLVTVAGGACDFLVANRPAAAETNTLAPIEAARLSVAVLPFANLSGDPTQNYLAGILTDELTTAFARLPGSFVIARNTAFTYKGVPVDAKAIGKDLGVRYVLEGSVQPGGERVRVDARLIDTDSGTQIRGDQFDAARFDLLQMQDEIFTHLAPAIVAQRADIEAARLNRKPTANPKAQDLAFQCIAAVEKGEFAGKEAEATFRLCEQALKADPENVRALSYLSLKFWFPVGLGRSADPEAGLKRADGLVSKALALDPDYAPAHAFKASIRELQTRYDEAIAEDERALALDPAIVDADAHLGWTYLGLGNFEKSHEYFDKAIRLSPHDPGLGLWVSGNTAACFGLKQYDQAIEWADRAIAINPSNVFAHGDLIAAFALTGREAEAHEALQRYLALPLTGIATIAAFKAFLAQVANPRSDPRTLEGWERTIDGLRKAGMPEE
ncbi:tetratricopeptide repeat protein [Methylocapsa sp. S129]|uniref:tetratricopeptide repeat protein n=1 Tax=Methylocapsa sp. S129 TaxID=1641869 RepID=UPI00131CCF59|nr:tetratricopeptide repeat protein [Methylocapsa sp. S129]